MKQTILLAAAILCLASCKNNVIESETQCGPYTITPIAENVWHIQDCNDDNPAGETFDENGVKTHFNNCSDMYLLNGGKKALLIDLSNNVTWAEDAAGALRSIVSERIGDADLLIAFTHNHGDHTGMLPAFENDPDVNFLFPSADFSAFADKLPAGRSELFDEGREIDLGGMKVSTLAVPGHTAGSMVFFLEGQNILFSGDAVGSGHGVWIFDLDSYRSYVAGVQHLAAYIDDPANGIDADALKIYGGHWWQKDWFPELGDGTFGIRYIRDMQQLIADIADGTAETEPSNLDFQLLDTYFRNGQAIIAWNAALAEDFRAGK